MISATEKLRSTLASVSHFTNQIKVISSVKKVSAVAGSALLALSLAPAAQAAPLSLPAELESLVPLKGNVLGELEGTVLAPWQDASKNLDIVIGNLQDVTGELGRLGNSIPSSSPKQRPAPQTEKKTEEPTAPKQQNTSQRKEAYPKDKANFKACPSYAEACVDLPNQSAWLQQNGKVTYGPVDISSGVAGQETPSGNFTVAYKVKDEKSREFNDAPMPYAVYFTNNGHALHEGDPEEMSNGCVHLGGSDAKYFFNHLNVGDNIYIIG